MRVPFLAGLVVLVLLIILVSFIFLQFDPNAFRPDCEKYLEKISGFRTELGTLSIQWKSSPVLIMGGIRIVNYSGERLLEAPRAEARVPAFPLLWRHELLIDTLELEAPHIFLARSKDNAWNWSGRTAPRNGRAKEKWKIWIQSFRARQATVHYSDASELPVFQSRLAGMEISIKNPRFLSPALIEFKFSSDPSLLWVGNLTLDPGHFMRLELAHEDKAFVQMSSVLFGTHPPSRLKISLKSFDLNLLPQDWQRGLGLSGRAWLEAEGSAEGLHPALVGHSLQLKMNLRIQEGSLKNVNLIDEALTQLAALPIPGFSHLAEAELPRPLQDLRHQKQTPFDMLTGEVEVLGDRVLAKNFLMLGRDYTVEGSGPLKGMNFHGNLIFSEEVSRKLLDEVPDLGILKDPRQLVAVPFEYRGAGSLSINPFFIANRFVQMRGEELLLEAHKK